MEFHVEDMTCGGCARGVTRAIQAIDANAKVITEPPNRSVRSCIHKHIFLNN